jgi:hypothetical protein
MIECLITFQRSFLPDDFTNEMFEKSVFPVVCQFDLFKYKEEVDYQF